MNLEDPNEGDGIPSLGELRRITSPASVGSFDSNASREVFLALGQTAEAAASDFDWRRIAAKLESEIAAESNRSQRLVRVPRRPSFVYVALASAAILLVALSIGFIAGNSANETARRPPRDPKPMVAEGGGLDSWERSSAATGADWQDEIDLKLAATRRELRQGRDPWVNDEPVLSEVIAQIGDLNAGLVFDPF